MFLFEAICPFLRIFFSRYYRPGDPLLNSSVPNHREITGRAVDLMNHFLKRMLDVPAYGTPVRLRDVNTVLLAMEDKEVLTEDQVSVYQDQMSRAVDLQAKRREERKRLEQTNTKVANGKYSEHIPSRDLNRDSLRAYYAKYKAELALNDALHNFMDKVEWAYRYAPFTASACARPPWRVPNDQRARVAAQTGNECRPGDAQKRPALARIQPPASNRRRSPARVRVPDASGLDCTVHLVRRAARSRTSHPDARGVRKAH